MVCIKTLQHSAYSMLQCSEGDNRKRGGGGKEGGGGGERREVGGKVGGGGEGGRWGGGRWGEGGGRGLYKDIWAMHTYCLIVTEPPVMRGP